MKKEKVLMCLIFLIFCTWTTSGYLREYSVNRVNYTLWYDINDQSITMWKPVSKEIYFPNQIQKNLIQSIIRYGEEFGFCNEW